MPLLFRRPLKYSFKMGTTEEFCPKTKELIWANDVIIKGDWSTSLSSVTPAELIVESLKYDLSTLEVPGLRIELIFFSRQHVKHHPQLRLFASDGGDFSNPYDLLY